MIHSMFSWLVHKTTSLSPVGGIVDFFVGHVFLRVGWLSRTFMCLVTCYHLMVSNIFLNTAAVDAEGLEKWANTILIPFQYVFVGSAAIPCTGEDCFRYELHQRFDYKEHFYLKTTCSAILVPFSVSIGSILKGIAYLSPSVHARHVQIAEAFSPDCIRSNEEMYKKAGITLIPSDKMQRIPSLGYERKPGDENNLRFEKEALREVVELLSERNIPFWADCGTCLGAYRYGGSIPWDDDLDIGVLEPDFYNVKSALQQLDPSKYLIEDWSSRLNPETLLRLYIKRNGTYIDIYHFAIDPDRKVIKYILSHSENGLLPEAWKKSQECYLIDTPFDVVFPFKVASFDGIDLPVPNQVKKYLQMRYGEDLSPVKVFDVNTGKYEKDLQHPYWKEGRLK